MTDTDHGSAPEADVPTCGSDDEVAEARAAAAEAGRPLLYVKTRGDYAFVEADMAVADARLETLAVADAAEVVREAKEDASDGTPEATPVTASADPRGVTVGPLTVPAAEAVAADLAPVVFDEGNWTTA